jgi:hypothetical protein
MLVHCSNSSGGTRKLTQTVIDATRKESAIDQQQHSCETLKCRRHQTILRFLFTAATASTRWRVGEFYCQTSYATDSKLRHELIEVVH